MKKLIRNIIFFMRLYVKINNTIKELKVRKVRIFKFYNWHHGCCYFSAYTEEGIKVFLKLDTKLLLLVNELTVYNMLKDAKDIKVIKVLKFVNKKNIQLIMLEFISSHELTENDIKDDPSILSKAYSALVSLNKENIIHRDIRLENFLVSGNDLYLIDFSFAYHIRSSDMELKELPYSTNNYFILKGLGNRMDHADNDFVWNDFYSMAEILRKLLNQKDINTSSYRQLDSYFRRFNSKVQGNSYSLSFKSPIQ